MSTYIHNPTVDESFLYDVKEALGYPVVDEEIADIYTDEQIENLVIADALEHFFNYFPIVQTIVTPVSPNGKVELDAPENTLGIVHYALDGRGSGGINLNTGNPFYTARMVVSSQSGLANYGSPFNYNGSEYSVYQQQFYANSAQKVSGGRSFAVYYNASTDKIEVQSVMGGTMTIRVGCYSEDVDDIPKRLRPHFLGYCQGMLKVKFANILMMMNSDLPLEFDKEAILESGKEMVEAEDEWFRINSTIQLMK